MKKVYQKPQAVVEDFVLDQFIAASCAVKTYFADTACWNRFIKKEDNPNDPEYDKLDPFTKIAIEDTKQFAGGVCEINADDDNDTLCYHTQGSPLFQS